MVVGVLTDVGTFGAGLTFFINKWSALGFGTPPIHDAGWRLPGQAALVLASQKS